MSERKNQIPVEKQLTMKDLGECGGRYSVEQNSGAEWRAEDGKLT